MFGWKWKYPTMEWHKLCIDKYPGWEIESEETPAFVKLTHIRGGEDVESAEIANSWDDIAKEHFYQRDWTDSGIPFVSEGDTYWSGWWFQTLAERDRFGVWVAQRLIVKAVTKSAREVAKARGQDLSLVGKQDHVIDTLTGKRSDHD